LAVGRGDEGFFEGVGDGVHGVWVGVSGCGWLRVRTGGKGGERLIGAECARGDARWANENLHYVKDVIGEIGKGHDTCALSRPFSPHIS